MGHSMEMPFFSVPSLYRNITLEKHFRITISLYFKTKQYVIWTITPSWAINVAIYIFFNNYKEFQAPQICLSTAMYSQAPERALFWGQKKFFLPFKMQ